MIETVVRPANKSSFNWRSGNVKLDVALAHETPRRYSNGEGDLRPQQGWRHRQQLMCKRARHGSSLPAHAVDTVHRIPCVVWRVP